MTKQLAELPTTLAIATELQEITNAIIEAGGECDDATLAKLKEWNAAIEVKGENIALVNARLESEMEYFKAIEGAASAQRKARESSISRLKKYLAACMAIGCVKSIKKKDGLFSISLCPGRTSVRIPDPALLPLDKTELVTVYKPKTDEIKADLEAGKQVPGASIEVGEPYITIRGGKPRA